MVQYYKSAEEAQSHISEAAMVMGRGEFNVEKSPANRLMETAVERWVIAMYSSRSNAFLGYF